MATLETRKMIEEFKKEANEIESREDLAEFTLSILRATQDGDMPNVPLNIYLRALAQVMRGVGRKEGGSGFVEESKSEWSLIAIAFVEAFPTK